MVVNIENKIEFLISTPSDINEHIPTIVKYGKKCDHITEMGVRGVVSTWGWLAATPKKLVCYDMQHPSNFGGNLVDIKDTADSLNVKFEFNLANVLDVEIEETDLLFIDTLHVYPQIKQELKLHAGKVRKYIAFHDTETFGYKGEYDGYVGLWPAIEEFIQENPEWQILERFTNNNGFTVLVKGN